MKESAWLLISFGLLLISVVIGNHLLRWYNRKRREKAERDLRFERIMNEISKRQREEEEELWK